MLSSQREYSQPVIRSDLYWVKWAVNSLYLYGIPEINEKLGDGLDFRRDLYHMKVL